MRSRAFGTLLLGALALGGLSPRPAIAQAGQPQITVQASARKVEVGELFTIQLRASGEQVAPNTPELKVPAGLAVVGQSLSQFGNRFNRSVDVQWSIVPQKPGHYTIPGPSITINQSRHTSSPIVIDVTPATPGGSAQQKRQSPFLFPGGPSISFGSGFGSLFGDDPDDDLDPREAPNLSLPAAPDPYIFLRAVPDKKTAVIGEQITLSFYVYARVSFSVDESHEAPLSDFRRVSLVSNPGAEGEQRARAGTELYMVRLLDRMALFPLRAGELHTGQLKVKLTARRIGSNVERASDDQVITVTEPPKENRPPGYVLGDVGQFSLSANVVPRAIEQGGSVAVNVKVTGTGNFPQQVHLPERTGLEWLDPEKKEQLGVQNGAVTGAKTFGYVVRVSQPGQVDLGTIELSYWNPSNRRYEQTKAVLGEVSVTAPLGPRAKDPADKDPSSKDTAGKNGEPDSADPFGTLGAPRLVLGAYTAPRPPRWGEGALLWGLLAAPPLLVGLGFAAAGSARQIRSRRATAKASPASLAAVVLREAGEAEARGDVKGMAAAVERALHLGIEGATGLKSRGVLLQDLPAELIEHDLPEEMASAIGEALAACESVRFDPAGEAARDLLSRARSLVNDLIRREPS
ncbi:MAG: BatD family protein [Byssovorax sp.]